MLDPIFERLYGTYSENDFKELFEVIAKRGLLGNRDWNPNRPEHDFQILMAKRKDEEDEQRTKTGYIAPEQHADCNSDIH